MPRFIVSCILSLSLLQASMASGFIDEDAMALFQGEIKKHGEVPSFSGAFEELNTPDMSAVLALHKAKQAREDAERKLAEASRARELAEVQAREREESLKRQAKSEAEERARAEILHKEKVAQEQLEADRQAERERTQKQFEMRKAARERKVQQEESAAAQRVLDRAKEKLEKQAQWEYKQKVLERLREEKKLQEDLTDAGTAQIKEKAAEKVVEMEKGNDFKDKKRRAKKDDPSDDITNAMGDLSIEDIMELINTLTEALKDKSFKKDIGSAIKELEALVAKYAQQNKELALEFVRQSASTYDAEGSVALLAKYFNETLDIEAIHSERADVIRSKLEDAMPDKLRDALTPLMGMLAPTNFTPPFDYAKFKSTPPAEICGQVNEFMTTEVSYQTNVTRVHTLLNTTASMLPMLSSFLPDTPEAVTTFLEDLMNLGFIETIAREKSTYDCLTMVGPIITEKLQCQWASGAPKRAQLFVALASLLAGWLIQ